MENQTQKAAQEFIDLYSEEIRLGEVNVNCVYEWWTHTKEQYEDTQYEDVESAIMNILFN